MWYISFMELQSDISIMKKPKMQWMRRLTEKPWFGKKYFGWGLRPITAEGWIVTLLFIAIALSSLHYFGDTEISTGIILTAVAALLIIAYFTSDEMGSVVYDRLKAKYNR